MNFKIRYKYNCVQNREMYISDLGEKNTNFVEYREEEIKNVER